MEHLRKFVFISEIVLRSNSSFDSIYKGSMRIFDGLKLDFSSAHGINGSVSFETVFADTNTTSFRVLIETDEKRMYDEESYYISAIKTCLQSMLVSDYEIESKVVKLRIPSMLSVGQLNPQLYTDPDGDHYLLTKGEFFLKKDSIN